MSTPSRRAASPGCGVASVGASRACVAASNAGSRAMRLSASASSASGICSASARMSSVRAASLVPSPGPRRAHRAARRAPTPAWRSMSSGMPVSSLGGSAIRNPSHTLPAPARIAARPARISAPTMPSVPPRMPERAEGSLVHVARAAREHGAAMRPPAPASRGDARAHRRPVAMPSECTDTSPH